MYNGSGVQFFSSVSLFREAALYQGYYIYLNIVQLTLKLYTLASSLVFLNIYDTK